MDARWKKELIGLIGSARNKEEIGELLSTLLTPAEHDELARRWQIVKRLIEGSTQRKVKEELKVSIATVTRGSRELKYGKGIFQKFYKRLRDKKTR